MDDCLRLFRNLGSYDAPRWQEMKNIKGLTLNLESIEFEMMWDTTDGDLNAIGKAFLTKTQIEFAVFGGASNIADSQGLRATMVITNFGQLDPLKKQSKFIVTAKPTYIDNAPERCAPFFLEGKAMDDSNAISDAIERSRAREAALQYRVGELIECNPRDLDQAVSMLLYGIPLAAGSEVFWQNLAEQLPSIAEQLRGFRAAFGRAGR